MSRLLIGYAQEVVDERRGLNTLPATGTVLEITHPRDPATSLLDSRFPIHYKLGSVQSVPNQPISLDITQSAPSQNQAYKITYNILFTEPRPVGGELQFRLA